MSPFFIALLQKMAIITTFTFFGGFTMNKVMTPMSSPYSLVVVL
jgi:hypothetical protein